MFETLFLFIALFILEVILEIDNLTALRRAAEGLPDTTWCRGQMPHALALGVRVVLVYVLVHLISFCSHITSLSGQQHFEQFGGMMIILMAVGLIINYLQGGRAVKSNLSRRIVAKKTSLASFLLADAFLSMDTVIAAVAMTTSFSLAVTALVSASVAIMIFHKPLQSWLKLNPRMALLAYVVIGLLGANLILAGSGIIIPKFCLLIVVFAGLWFDRIDRDTKKMRAQEKDALQQRAKRSTAPGAGKASHLVGTIDLKARDLEFAAGRPVNQPEEKRTVVPKTVDASWTEVVQRSEDLRGLIRAEQAKPGSTYSYAPDGKKIKAAQSPESAATINFSPAEKFNGYVFGTNHSAAVAHGQYGFIMMSSQEDTICSGCGKKQPISISICDGCGHYRFFCPAGIFEVGKLRLLTMRA
jgi:predicted tellurium resistance membrane protein TerC